MKIWLYLVLLFALPLLSLGETHFTEVGQQFNVRGYSYFGGNGACWVDVNRDGKLDLFVKNAWAEGILAVPDILYINVGTTFLDEAASRGVSDPYVLGTGGAVFADLDGDRDFDLFCSTIYDGVTQAYNRLYKNDGAGSFQDITSAIVPPQALNTTTRGVAAADFDLDGDVDFYFSNPLSDPQEGSAGPLPPQQLANFLINNGDGTFSLEYRGIDWTGFVQGVCAVDVDGDGDIDIAEAKWGPPSTIYLNEGSGNFRDAGAELGLSTATGEDDNGLAFGDVDNDGDLDLAIINSGRIVLLKNENNHFSRYQTLWPARTQNGGFDLRFGDFDHDGYLELYVSGDTVFDNDNVEGEFTALPISDVGLEASANATDPRGAALGDFDNDGDLDVYLTDNKNYSLLFRNDIDNSDWIQVEITSDNYGVVGAIGTKLDLYAAGHLDELAYLKGHREIQGEYGYLGQDTPIAHFGAPSAGGAKYDLKVAFPDGTVKLFRDLTPGQKIQVAPISPPLDFRGVKKENRALFYRETLIELTWQANPKNVDVTKYRIWGFNPDKTLLGEVTADTYKFIVRNINKALTYRFGITSVGVENDESEPAYATVNGGTKTSDFNRKKSRRVLKRNL